MEKFVIFVIAAALLQQAIAIHDKVPTGCSRKYEAYNSCGSACPLTCKNKEPKSCSRQCVPGCYCMNGYVRNEADGSCCTPDECPGSQSACSLNEVYSTCVSSCPLTCDNYSDPPMACILDCKVGCECNKGYVRNKANGSCCLPTEC